MADSKSKKRLVGTRMAHVEHMAEPLTWTFTQVTHHTHAATMPYACRLQPGRPSEGNETVGEGRHVAFVLLFSLHLLGSLGSPWTSVRLILSPGVTVTPTAAGGGGGVCAGKEAIVSNYPTWDLETEARAEPAAAPSRHENSLR